MSRAGPDRAGPDRAGPDRAGPARAVRVGPAWALPLPGHDDAALAGTLRSLQATLIPAAMDAQICNLCRAPAPSAMLDPVAGALEAFSRGEAVRHRITLRQTPVFCACKAYLLAAKLMWDGFDADFECHLADPAALRSRVVDLSPTWSPQAADALYLERGGQTFEFLRWVDLSEVASSVSEALGALSHGQVCIEVHGLAGLSLFFFRRPAAKMMLALKPVWDGARLAAHYLKFMTQRASRRDARRYLPEGLRPLAREAVMTAASFVAFSGAPFAPYPPNECAHCGRETRRRCSGCHLVWYCDGDCQRPHWRATHRRECGSIARKLDGDAIARFLGDHGVGSSVLVMDVADS